jgi:hypothetical protein
MSEPTLEDRVTTLERVVAELLRQRSGPVTPPTTGKWWEQVGNPPMTEDEQTAFDEMLEYGRYFRKTGRDAPPDWKPGDPIPEPDYDQ